MRTFFHGSFLAPPFSPDSGGFLGRRFSPRHGCDGSAALAPTRFSFYRFVWSFLGADVPCKDPPFAPALMAVIFPSLAALLVASLSGEHLFLGPT